MAVNGCSESLESYRAMGVSQLSCPIRAEPPREGMAHNPCVLVSKTGPLRSVTSKRELSYSNGDVPVCLMPSHFPSAQPYSIPYKKYISGHIFQKQDSMPMNLLMRATAYEKGPEV